MAYVSMMKPETLKCSILSFIRICWISFQSQLHGKMSAENLRGSSGKNQGHVHVKSLWWALIIGKDKRFIARSVLNSFIHVKRVVWIWEIAESRTNETEEEEISDIKEIIWRVAEIQFCHISCLGKKENFIENSIKLTQLIRNWLLWVKLVPIFWKIV